MNFDCMLKMFLLHVNVVVVRWAKNAMESLAVSLESSLCYLISYTHCINLYIIRKLFVVTLICSRDK